MSNGSDSKPSVKVHETIASMNAKAQTGEKLEPHEAELARKLELLARVKEIRSRTANGRGKVKKGKEGKDYVWVNIAEDRQLEFQSMGYSKVTDPEVVTQDSYRQQDGSHQRGDLVLYEIDKDLREAIALEAVIRGLEGVESPKRRLIDQLEQAGARFYEPPAP